mmetsp:Transcript_69936/g.193409  ORF Transcript_69936/g.193409 Transcript_69936/m.193409 type:complete len:279 (+) Transcript_69936:566-1402(+)
MPVHLLPGTLSQRRPDRTADAQPSQRVGRHRTGPHVELVARPGQQAAGRLEKRAVADHKLRVGVQHRRKGPRLQAHEAPGLQELSAEPPQQAPLRPVEPGEEHREADESAVAKRRQVAAEAPGRPEDDVAGVDLVPGKLIEDKDNSLGREEVELVPKVCGDVPQDPRIKAVVGLLLIVSPQAPAAHGIEDPGHVELRPELGSHDHEAEHAVIEALLHLHTRFGHCVQNNADLRVVKPGSTALRPEDVVLHAPSERPPEGLFSHLQPACRDQRGHYLCG